MMINPDPRQQEQRQHRGRAAQARGVVTEQRVAALYIGQYQARMLATRWRCAAGELDLVMLQDQMLIFVEVKQRRDHLLAAEAISPTQWRRLAATAEAFIAAHPEFHQHACRFDIALADRQGQIQLVENAQSFDAEF